MEFKGFSHDEIVFSDVDSPEDNWYRIKVSVPAEQVDSFLLSLLKAAKENTQDPPSPEEAFNLLINLCWQEFAYRSNLSPSSNPLLDLSVATPHLKPATEFFACLEGPLNQRCSLDFLKELDIPLQDISVDEDLVDQEISNQKAHFGTEIPFEYPIQRGDTLDGQLVVSNFDTDHEILRQNGTLTIPLSGDHFTFETIVFDQAINSFLGNSAKEITGVQNCSGNLQELFGVPSVRFTFTISSERRCQPASIETVLSHYEMRTDSELRASIRNAIENRLNEKAQMARESSLCEELLKFAPRLTSREELIIKNEFASSVKKDHANSTTSHNEVQGIIDEMWSESRESITNAAAFRKFITLLTDQLQVGYSEEGLLREIRLRADEKGMRPEELRKELIDSDELVQLQNVASQRALFQELLRRTNSDN